MITILFCRSLCSAQVGSNLEIFVGGQFARSRPAFRLPATNSMGWNGGATRYMGERWGFRGQVSGTYAVIGSVTIQRYSFMAGPAFRLNSNSRFAPTAHLLGGLGRESAVGATSSSPAVALGAGLDVVLRPRLAIRIAQGEYVFTRFAGKVQRSFRVASGLVFRF